PLAGLRGASPLPAPASGGPGRSATPPTPWRVAPRPVASRWRTTRTDGGYRWRTQSPSYWNFSRLRVQAGAPSQIRPRNYHCFLLLGKLGFPCWTNFHPVLFALFAPPQNERGVLGSGLN